MKMPNPWADHDPVPWDTVTAEGARNPPCEKCGSGGFPADVGLDHLNLFCQRSNARQPVKTAEVVLGRFRCLHCAVVDSLEEGKELVAHLLTEDRERVLDARNDPTSLSYRTGRWDPPVA